MISTGTPAGVDFARKPPCWLMPGDEMVVRVKGLRELVNPVSGGRAEGRRNRPFPLPSCSLAIAR